MHLSLSCNQSDCRDRQADMLRRPWTFPQPSGSNRGHATVSLSHNMNSFKTEPVVTSGALPHAVSYSESRWNTKTLNVQTNPWTISSRLFQIIGKFLRKDCWKHGGRFHSCWRMVRVMKEKLSTEEAAGRGNCIWSTDLGFWLSVKSWRDVRFSASSFSNWTFLLFIHKCGRNCGFFTRRSSASIIWGLPLSLLPGISPLHMFKFYYND